MQCAGEEREFLLDNLNGQDEDPGFDGTLILKWIFQY
jgi:hypothetical protein